MKKYIKTQSLINGQLYMVEKGCKAVVVDDMVKIESESDVKYLKEIYGSTTILYLRITPDNCTPIATYPDGSLLICNNETLKLHGAEIECSETEFMEVYNKAMKLLEL